MDLSQLKNGVLACSIGGTNTHAQVYDLNARLVSDWTVPTEGHSSLLELLVNCGEEAKKRLGTQPDIAGLLFAGPVERTTGRVTLTNVPQYADEEANLVDTSMALGMPTVHDNDVAGAARRLGRLRELNLTPLVEPELPKDDCGQQVLIEIGTGVGTGIRVVNEDAPQGMTLAAELQHAMSKLTGESHETNLCGSRGFERLVRLIKQSNLILPSYVRTALELGKDLGPIVTQTMVELPEHPFTLAILREYGAMLGEFLRLAQLAYQPSAIFFGGSVGRAPNFLDRVVRERDFWQHFLGLGLDHNVQIEAREQMPLVRITNEDLTVQGARDLALHRLIGA